jgi:hypothetical protein
VPSGSTTADSSCGEFETRCDVSAVETSAAENISAGRTGYKPMFRDTTFSIKLTEGNSEGFCERAKIAKVFPGKIAQSLFSWLPSVKMI